MEQLRRTLFDRLNQETNAGNSNHLEIELRFGRKKELHSNLDTSLREDQLRFIFDKICDYLVDEKSFERNKHKNTKNVLTEDWVWQIPRGTNGPFSSPQNQKFKYRKTIHLDPDDQKITYGSKQSYFNYDLPWFDDWYIRIGFSVERSLDPNHDEMPLIYFEEEHRNAPNLKRKKLRSQLHLSENARIDITKVGTMNSSSSSPESSLENTYIPTNQQFYEIEIEFIDMNAFFKHEIVNYILFCVSELLCYNSNS